MEVLNAVVAGALFVGCYSPELPDCAVACANDGDCAPGHGCADGFCVGPDHPGPCATATPADATNDNKDDKDNEKPPRPDAAHCVFTIAINGKGKVVIDGVARCSHMDSGGECSIDLPMASHDLVAIAEPGERFDKWTSLACHAQDESCYLAYCTATTPIGVKFVRDN